MERLQRHPAGLPSLVLLLLGSVFIAKATVVVGDVRYSYLFDDAMITLRYGRTLAEGFGFAWNPGEGRLEGCSSLLYVLLAALVHLAQVPEPLTSLVVSVIGLGILVALVWVVTELAEQLSPCSGPSAAWLTALCWPLVYWTLRGFEVGACALVLAGVALLVAREREDAAWCRCGDEMPRGRLECSRCAAFGDAFGGMAPGVAERIARMGRRYLATTALLAIGVLLRDDQAVLLGVVVAFSPRRLGLWGALAAIVALKVGWRLWYFGAPLPLTAYLKLEGVPLATRLARGSVAMLHELRFGLWLPVLACAAAVRRSWMPVAVFGSACAYSVWVGGDAFEAADMANRFVAPALPLAMVGLAVAVAEPGRPASRLAHLGVVAGSGLVLWGLAACRQWLPVELAQVDQPTPALLAVSCLGVIAAAACALLGARVATWTAVAVGVSFGASWFHELTDTEDNDWGRTLVLHGLAIRAATTEDATIAVVQAGIVPYFAHRRTIDELGRSEATIAHSAPVPVTWKPGHTKYDPAWTIGTLRPDLVDEIYMWPWRAEVIQSFGYEMASANLWIRHDSFKVDRKRIAALAFWDGRQRWP
jgi:hypothetical protein